jgi:Ni/Co efflux regulator RcnB
MKRLLLMMAAVASVTAAIPLAAPAFARDDDQGRRAERQDRGRGGGPERGGRRFEGDRGGGPRLERRSDEERPRPRYEDDRRARVPALGYGDRRERREDDRPRYEPRPRYEARPRDDDRPRYGDRGGGPRPQGFAAPPTARRGGYLPRNFSGEIVDDYRRYRLRTPPSGFAWVRVGRGFALVSMRDGQIFDMVQ